MIEMEFSIDSTVSMSFDIGASVPPEPESVVVPFGITTMIVAGNFDSPAGAYEEV